MTSAKTTRRKPVAAPDVPARTMRRKPVALAAAEATHGGADPEAASSYFAVVGEKGDVLFFSCGCSGMDAALGGGWPVGRVINIVGDKSSGKTLLAIEACANFRQEFKTGPIRYGEAEAAFDKPYAQALGMPVDSIEFAGAASDAEASAPADGVKRGKEKKAGRADNKLETVEDFYADLQDFMQRHKGKGPMLYVLDSLDALSDAAEMEREITDASYGGTKPKKLGEMFRRLIQPLQAAQCTLLIISQLKDKIGVTFGEKQTRSGGRALDYYATHIIWLAELGKVKRTIGGVERVIGVDVKARVKKNKVGLAYREFEYPILFGYGIDDLTANVEWLVKVKATSHLASVGLSEEGWKTSVPAIRNKGGDRARELRAALRRIVFKEWERIERQFLPPASKY